jgi:hypothetical protein
MHAATTATTPATAPTARVSVIIAFKAAVKAAFPIIVIARHILLYPSLTSEISCGFSALVPDFPFLVSRAGFFQCRFWFPVSGLALVPSPDFIGSGFGFI